MSEMHADLKAAQQRIQVLERNRKELEEAGKRTAERLIRAERRLSDANGEVLRLGFQLKHHLQLQAERDALASKLAELEGQEPVAWYVDDPLWGREYNTCPNMSDNRTGTPLYARPVPAEPVNARLLEALKKCRNRFAFYVEHHLNKGDSVRAEDNAQFVKLANEAIARAEAALAAPQPDADGWIPWAGGECPVPKGTEFFARLRDLEEYGDDTPEEWRWSHSDPRSNKWRDDIIAYRVVKP